MADVFICYSRKNLEFVRKLHTAFKKLNRDPWVDWHSVPPSSKWMAEILAGIEGADTLVFVISSDSVLSTMCRKELAHAVANNKRVIPVILCPVAPEQLPRPLTEIQWISFGPDVTFETAVLRLMEAVDTNLDWIRLHTRILVRAIEWERKGRDKSFLLRGTDLQAAIQWLAQATSIKEPSPSVLQRQYIEASQESEAAEIRRLRELNEEKERQYQIAIARQLAAQAELLIREDPTEFERAALLSIESIYRVPLVENDYVLRQILPLLPKLMINIETIDAVWFSSSGSFLFTRSGGSVKTFSVIDGKEISPWTDQDPVCDPGDNARRIRPGTRYDELARLGYNGRVVAFSLDTSYVVTGNDDSSLSVLQTSSAEEVSRVNTRDLIEAVAFSPDGRYVAAGCLDRTASVFEARSGIEVSRAFTLGRVEAVAFSLEGEYLAAGGWSTTHIFKSLSGIEVARLTTPGHVKALAFSPDGRYLASGTSDGTLRVFEMGGLGGMSRLSHDVIVHSAAFNTDGKYVITGSGDNFARVFEVEGGKEVSRLGLDASGEILAVAFSPDGRRVGAGSTDTTARVFEVVGRREVLRTNHGEPVRAVAFSSDGQHFAAGGEDSVARVFDLNTGEQVSQLVHPGKVTAIAFSPDGGYVATGSADKVVRLMETGSGKELLRLSHPDEVAAVTFSPNGRYIATGGRDYLQRVFELSSGREVSKLGHLGWVVAIVFSPDGSRIATGGWDKTARIFKAADGKELSRMSDRGPVFAIAFTPDARALYTAACVDFGKDPVKSGVFITRHCLRPEDLIGETCSRLTRNLKLEEWQQYIGDEPYRKTVPELP